MANPERLPQPAERLRPRYRGALTFAVLVTALTWTVFAFLDIGGYRETADMASLDDIVDTSAMLLAVVVGGLAMVRWRVGRDEDDLPIGVALVVFGLASIGFDNLLVPRLPDDLQDEAATELVAALGLVAVVALLAVPVLRRRRAPRWRARPALVAAGAVVVALWMSSTLAAIAAGRRSRNIEGTGEAVGQVVVAAVFLLLAWAYWRRARAEQRTFHAWVALALFALAQSRVALALTASSETLWLAGSRILRLEALFFALMGINRELQEGFARQQSELRSSEARVQSMETQRAAERAALEERRHDVRSALFAIGGVAELLRRSHEELDAGTLEALTQALGAEVTRLQGLVAEQEREECLPFSLLTMVSPLVLMERSNGLDVTCTVSEHLLAVGRPKETAQALRNLLDNARLYAPGSPVTVRAEERDEWVVVLVEDRGPGIAPDERKAVFERAHRGAASDGTDGSGLGLYVASKLMREQGGDLWVTDRAGGGASFVLSLPAPRRRH